MKKMRTPWVFFLVVIMLPVSALAVIRFYERQFQRLPVLVSPDHHIADFQFRNQANTIVSKSDWQGKIVVANFFFTHCGSICPKMMYGLKRVQAYAKVPQLQIASFTVDPERDSVGRLKDYAKGFQITGNWNLLTGSKREIYLLARNSFMVSATEGDGGPDDFIHSDRLVLIDRAGRIRGFYKGTEETEINNLVHDAEKLAGE